MVSHEWAMPYMHVSKLFVSRIYCTFKTCLTSAKNNNCDNVSNNNHNKRTMLTIIIIVLIQIKVCKNSIIISYRGGSGIL